jgi:outer membrane protein assembly factor BamB
MRFFRALALLAPLLPATAADWPAWGRFEHRHMVNTVEKNLPHEWDIMSGRNIKWVANLGSQSYGNPSVGGGRILLGTNNELMRDKAIVGDKGVVMCFNEADGAFLWQAVFDKLESGRVNDWPLQGVCSSPWIEGDRAWFLNNRAQLVCVDMKGFKDGKNDGMQDEKYKGPEHADILWSFDLIEELGVFPHNLATSSPVIWKDMVYVVTGNGVDEGHLNLPAPNAPSFVAVDKNTGELMWHFVTPERILHGQWSSPSAGLFKGREQVLMTGGDGWVYGFNPLTGDILWKFDGNPKDAKYELGGYGTRNYIISTPAVYNERMYFAMGQDPEHGTGIGHFYAVDLDGEGDVTQSKRVWHYGGEKFGRTLSTAAVKDGRVYMAELAGYLHCLDAATGTPLWKHDLQSAVWGSGYIVDGKIYIGDEDGDMLVLQEGAEKKILKENTMEGSIYSTPIAANGVLYVMTKSKLYAIAHKE